MKLFHASSRTAQVVFQQGLVAVSAPSHYEVSGQDGSAKRNPPSRQRRNRRITLCWLRREFAYCASGVAYVMPWAEAIGFDARDAIKAMSKIRKQLSLKPSRD
jgi:hypothetical protein